MCLSKVYLKEKEDGSLIIDEASRLKADRDGVEVRSLFGEHRSLKGYYMSEVNLIENYVVLMRKDNSHG